MKSEELTYRQGIKNQLDRIESQVLKTNGRVTKLEKFNWIVGTALLVLLWTKFPEIAHILAAL